MTKTGKNKENILMKQKWLSLLALMLCVTLLLPTIAVSESTDGGAAFQMKH